MLETKNVDTVFIPSTVKKIGKAIASAIENKDAELAWVLFIQLSDNLASCNYRYLTLVTQDAPNAISRQWDLAIAGLVEYRLNLRSSSLPIWVKEKNRPMSKPWIPYPNQYGIPVDIARVPQEFLLRGVLVEAETLQSV